MTPCVYLISRDGCLLSEHNTNRDQYLSKPVDSDSNQNRHTAQLAGDLEIGAG
jgi:hypothetical protein